MLERFFLRNRHATEDLSQVMLTDNRFLLTSQGFSEFVINHPNFASQLQEEYSRYPRRVIIGIIPSIDTVVAVWRDDTKQTKVVGFTPDLSCTKEAVRDAILEARKNSDDRIYHIFHTNNELKYLRGQAKTKSRLFLEKTFRELVFDQNAHMPPFDTFNYRSFEMLHVNYIALIAMGDISGEIVYSLSENHPDK